MFTVVPSFIRIVPFFCQFLINLFRNLCQQIGCPEIEKKNDRKQRRLTSFFDFVNTIYSILDVSLRQRQTRNVGLRTMPVSTPALIFSD